MDQARHRSYTNTRRCGHNCGDRFGRRLERVEIGQIERQHAEGVGPLEIHVPALYPAQVRCHNIRDTESVSAGRLRVRRVPDFARVRTQSSSDRAQTGGVIEMVVYISALNVLPAELGGVRVAFSIDSTQREAVPPEDQPAARPVKTNKSGHAVKGRTSLSHNLPHTHWDRRGLSACDLARSSSPGLQVVASTRPFYGNTDQNSAKKRVKLAKGVRPRGGSFFPFEVASQTYKAAKLPSKRDLLRNNQKRKINMARFDQEQAAKPRRSATGAAERRFQSVGGMEPSLGGYRSAEPGRGYVSITSSSPTQPSGVLGEAL
ncbi:hypothetical protein Bbelb_097310 [Branchiostoma belcheri]|nr:hypothetical protein Bbelb_097310 [Branchiostoma belcheri]